MADANHEGAITHVNANLRYERYRDTRFWAIYYQNELLAVTVYKKGAQAVCETLMRLTSQDPDPDPSPTQAPA